MGKIINIC